MDKLFLSLQAKTKLRGTALVVYALAELDRHQDQRMKITRKQLKLIESIEAYGIRKEKETDPIYDKLILFYTEPEKKEEEIENS